jgi:hypothetical protein
MQTDWQNFSSRTDAHENAPKRSLFVNYSSTDLVDARNFADGSWPDLEYSSNNFCRFLMLIRNQQVVGSNPTAGSLVNRGLILIRRRLLGHFLDTFALPTV